MAEILKKKRSSPVRTVSVKMKCGCYGAACDCACPHSAHTTTTVHCDPDVCCCGNLFFKGQADDVIIYA